MNKKAITAIIALGVLVGAVTLAAFNPLRKSEPKIQMVLLKATPLGTSESEVRSFVEKKGWLDSKYSGTTGYLKQISGKADRVIGVTSIRGHLGAYRSLPVPILTDVTAFWAFDEKGRLIDVWVWKTIDAP